MRVYSHSLAFHWPHRLTAGEDDGEQNYETAEGSEISEDGDDDLPALVPQPAGPDTTLQVGFQTLNPKP
jgi:hypothetical protein